MQYKGEDLDLRVPHARGPREGYAPDYDPAGNGRWARTPGTAPGGGEPLWVDEVLLACCNYAFDVAQANGAAEVGLEHLVNALTRVDTAARTLEARGVREGQLRRESAALIASEIPAPNAGEAAVPRRSPELEDALRRAAEIAQRRGAPAGVEDVLWVLLHYPRDMPVLQLLRRLAPDWQRADWGRVRDFVAPEPPPSPPRTMHLAAGDGMSSRMAAIEDGLRLMQVEFAAERKALVELVRDIQRDVVAQRGDGAAFRGDLGQRLETLERAVQMRGDSSRIAVQIAERVAGLEKTLHGNLGDAARGTAQLAQRLASLEMTLSDGRGAAGQQAVAERLAALEHAVHAGLGDAARGTAQLGQRLGALELAVGDGRGGGGQQTAERLTALEKAVHSGLSEGARNWSHLGQRLTGLESAIAEARGSGGEAVAERIANIERTMQSALAGLPGRLPEALAGRLGQIERKLETVADDGRQQWADLAERVGEFGRLIETGRADASRLRTEVVDRLKTIEARTGEGDGTGVRELYERLGGLERAVRAGFGDAAQTTGQIAERLLVVERGMAEQRSRDDGEALLVLDDRLGAIERMLDARGQQSVSAAAEVVERLRILESRPTVAGGIDMAALVSPLTSRLDSLETASLGRSDGLAATLGDINARLAALEERMRAEAQVTEEALRGRDQDFDFIYSEIKQLGQSQATLNSAVGDWRSESQTHFGTLAARLDKLQAQAAPLPVQAPAAEVMLPPTSPFDLPAVAKGRNGADPAVHQAGMRPEPQRSPVPQLGRTGAENVRADDYALPPQPGRGFWFWLFGTTSVSRANRENDLKVDRMRQNIRDARARRRTQA